MKGKKLTLLLFFLLLTCLAVHLYSRNETRVENDYSNGFFPGFAAVLRGIFGKIPISIGDILYGLAVAWLLWKAGKWLWRLIKRNKTKPEPQNPWLITAGKILLIASIIYIIFNVFWGINYNRKGIGWQLGLKMGEYSKEELVEMNRLLVQKININKEALIKKNRSYPSNREMFGMVTEAYKKAARQYPFLDCSPPSLKSSMWGWLGNYTGFTGYYNPFTGEAQVNISIPKFLQPFVACHEVAHQVGYAKEMEANFVGYLAAAHSGNELLQYSVYLDLFVYANRNLFYTDSVAAKDCRKGLLPQVHDDLKAWLKFSREHESFIEPVIRWVYGMYLRGNRQPSGIASYDEVTGFIIAYYRKFGVI